MKTAPGVLTVGLSIALTIGSAAVVAAQDEADDVDLTATTYVTGTLGDAAGFEAGTDTVQSADLVEHRDYVWTDALLETSDPRLSGSASWAANGNERFVFGAPEYVDTQAFQIRVLNDDGAWSGQGTAFIHGRSNAAPTTNLLTVLLVGEGAYEGLSAYLLIDPTESPVAIEGSVFAGELTPFPEALPSE